jgi:hypothetical protein
LKLREISEAVRLLRFFLHSSVEMTTTEGPPDDDDGVAEDEVAEGGGRVRLVDIGTSCRLPAGPPLLLPEPLVLLWALLVLGLDLAPSLLMPMLGLALGLTGLVMLLLVEFWRLVGVLWLGLADRLAEIAGPAVEVGVDGGAALASACESEGKGGRDGREANEG